MRGKKDQKNQKRALQLRIKERLSNGEISRLLSVPKPTLTNWLAEHPLSKEERKEASKRNIRGANPKKDRGIESKHHRTRNSSLLTKHEKAKIAEAAALFRLLLNGFSVFGSVFDGDKADWIVGKEKELHKVQVRWTREEPCGLPNVSVRCSDGRNKSRTYREGEFDFLVGYNLFNDTCYVWSWEEVKDYLSCITIHPDAAERWDKIRSTEGGDDVPT